MKVDTLNKRYYGGYTKAVYATPSDTLRHMPVSEFVNAFKHHVDDWPKLFQNTKEPQQMVPEIEALRFYFLNHCMALIDQKLMPLDQPVQYQPLLDEYHKAMPAMVTRMFWYLILICTRESRHSHASVGDYTMNQLAAAHGEGCVKFWFSIKGTGSSGAVAGFKTNPPQGVTMGQYASFLVDIFYKTKYTGGYGGPAWGKVADCLESYVNGKISAELMLDTSFTLAHNNGPIFNKGMLFSGYTKHLIHILDIQRAGMIPQMIHQGITEFSKNSEIVRLHTMAKEVLLGEVMGTVDYYQVKQLGAVGDYDYQIKQQSDEGKVPPSKVLTPDQIKETVTTGKKIPFNTIDPVELEKYATHPTPEKVLGYVTLTPKHQVAIIPSPRKVQP